MRNHDDLFYFFNRYTFMFVQRHDPTTQAVPFISVMPAVLSNVFQTFPVTLFFTWPLPQHASSSPVTSVCCVELDAKVSIRSSGVVAGSEDDASDGFVFPDHTGDGRCGHYPVVSNDETTHLCKCQTGGCVSWLPSSCFLISLRRKGE